MSGVALTSAASATIVALGSRTTTGATGAADDATFGGILDEVGSDLTRRPVGGSATGQDGDRRRALQASTLSQAQAFDVSDTTGSVPAITDPATSSVAKLAAAILSAASAQHAGRAAAVASLPATTPIEPEADPLVPSLSADTPSAGPTATSGGDEGTDPETAPDAASQATDAGSFAASATPLLSAVVLPQTSIAIAVASGTQAGSLAMTSAVAATSPAAAGSAGKVAQGSRTDQTQDGSDPSGDAEVYAALDLSASQSTADHGPVPRASMTTDMAGGDASAQVSQTEHADVPLPNAEATRAAPRATDRKLPASPARDIAAASDPSEISPSVPTTQPGPQRSTLPVVPSPTAASNAGTKASLSAPSSDPAGPSAVADGTGPASTSTYDASSVDSARPVTPAGGPSQAAAVPSSAGAAQPGAAGQVVAALQSLGLGSTTAPSSASKGVTTATRTAGADTTANVDATRPAETRMVTLKLSPEHLGPVSITMRVTGGRVDIKITVDSTDALRVLERARHVITAAVEAAGSRGGELVVAQPGKDGGSTSLSGNDAAPRPSNTGSGFASSGSAGDGQPRNSQHADPLSGPQIAAIAADDDTIQPSASRIGRDGSLYV